MLWPLACALFVAPLGRWREGARDAFVVLSTGVALAGAAALVPLVRAEHVIGVSVPALLGRIVFTADSYSMLFAITTTLLWFAATLYSVGYLKHEQRRDRFHTASLVALSAMLGVVLAGDLVTLYLFFEVLGLVAFLLVIHTETDEARRASIKYLWMTVLGGFALVAGIFLTFALGGNGLIAPLPLEAGSETLRWVTFGLLVLGFGVKAGMLPVHVWLPDAHPVAPSPASALLSGVMIKAGAYGIFRTATALFRPPVAEHVEESLWHLTSDFGLAILWIGIATMAVGVVMALGQSNAKRMLAYHSISQMGFILAGIGAAAYLGTEGALGVAGGIYHVANHALFKGTLFLGVGAVAFRTGELDMYKLGGLWRRMPLTFAFTLVAAAGITGVPLFNGFVSKCLIHHALVEAHELHHLASLGVAEWIYIVTCGGTACSFIKLIGFVFLGSPKREYGAEVTDPPATMLVGMGILCAGIVTLGLWPGLLLRGVFEPGLHTWGLEAELLDHYLAASFLSGSDLLSVLIAFAIGATVFATGVRFGLFHLRAPEWFGVNHWYLRLAGAIVPFCDALDHGYARYRSAFSHTLHRARDRYHRAWVRSERNWRRMAVGLATGAAEPFGQRFVREASFALTRERQESVRQAVSVAGGWAHRRRSGSSQREAMIVAAREIASSFAQSVYSARVEFLATLQHGNEIDTAREGFDTAIGSLGIFRERMAAETVRLAAKRCAGHDVSAEVEEVKTAILAADDFAGLLLGSETRSHAPTLAEWRDMGMGRMELAAGWMVDLTRILVEALNQEHVEWTPERIDAATVITVRRNIQRYARDMSINIAMILVVFLILLASIAVAGSP